MTIFKSDGAFVDNIIGADTMHAWSAPADPRHQPNPFILWPDETISFI